MEPPISPLWPGPCSKGGRAENGSWGTKERFCKEGGEEEERNLEEKGAPVERSRESREDQLIRG
jgi:hypothetical protein